MKNKNWDLNFIAKQDLTKHVEITINKYGDKLQSFNLERFNKNIIDPIKLIFDKIVYKASWEEIISNEIFRQRDKSNNNDIGYFHQGIFKYFNKCTVPTNGWDIIFKDSNGIVLPNKETVKTIYVELKNKHNTMNSASASKTFIKMQNQLLHDDECACFLVEVIAKHSQNIKWETTIDGKKVGHKLIRRVSIDEFYALVTGEENAFYKLCMVLPEIIEEVVHNSTQIATPQDTVLSELKNKASSLDICEQDLAIAMAAYLLGFKNYKGFTG